MYNKVFLVETKTNYMPIYLDWARFDSSVNIILDNACVLNSGFNFYYTSSLTYMGDYEMRL